jgi:DnaJ homolog subfamily A member 5
VRKRDPRHKAHLARQAERSQSQTPGSATPVGDTSHKRTQIVQEYVEQDWQRVDAAPLHADLDWAAAEGEDPEEWECVACRKSFRSEAAWDSHERSKKHMKEVESLRREMMEQNEEFGLHGEEAEEEEGGRECEELDPLEVPSPPIPSPPVVPVTVIDDPSILPCSVPPSGSSKCEREPNLSRENQKSTEESTRTSTGSRSLPETQRKATRAPQSEKTRPKKLEPQGDRSDTSTTTPDGAAVDTLPEAGGVSADGSVLEDTDDTGQPAAGQLDANTPVELTKRDKRRARQAKKAEAGETLGSEVTFYSFLYHSAWTNICPCSASLQRLPPAIRKQDKIVCTYQRDRPRASRFC